MSYMSDDSIFYEDNDDYDEIKDFTYDQANYAIQ